MIISLRWTKLGGHIHCRLFPAPGPDRTFAKCGDLTFDEREWPEVKSKFEKIGEVIPDE